MRYDSEKHHRRSIRLQNYDYTMPGAYFVTICTRERACLFGVIRDGEMWLNDAGRAVEASWNKLPARYPNISLDGFVIMPNHVHGIIVVGAPLVGALVAMCGDGATGKRATTRVAPTVGEIMGAFKSITTDEYIRGVKSASWPSFNVRLWQRNYYEHIIRDDESLNRIRQYISDNPSHWAFDRENPAATTPEPEEAWLA